MPKTKIINEEKIKHTETYNAGKVNAISFISLLMGFAQAVMIYILSSYFRLISGTENVGVFYLFSYAISFILLLNFHKIVKKFGKSEVFHFSVIAKIFSIAFLIITPSNWLSLPFLILYIISGNLEWVSIDIILESFSADRMSGRIRGKYLAIMNLGYFLGPFISTHIMKQLDFKGVFAFLFIINIFLLYFSLSKIRKVNHVLRGDLTIRDITSKIIVRKNILRIYYISFVLEFFYALMVIYTPIYLIDLGMGWEKIGLIFTFMLAPFVFMQYPAGALADKKFGEKEMIIISIFVMAASTLAVYFIESREIVIWAAVLMLTRIGAAPLEILRDSYFYKRIDGRDVDFINFFRTAMPMGYISGAVLATIILLFFPVKAIFILVSAVVFSALVPAFFLLDSKCEKEMKACK